MFEKRIVNGLTIFKSDNIETKHLFSTRCGGVSSLPHLVSLNVGENRGDSEENVRENLSRLMSALGTDADSLVRAKQIHSNKVRAVGVSDRGRMFDDCDGFVTKDKGVTLLVKVADCVPILLYDKDSSVAGALHAGWRGACSGIALEGVGKMLSLGAKVGNIKVAIGACIHSCCYQVGQDLAAAVAEKMGGENAASCLIKDNEEGKYRADIVKMNLFWLERAGISRENISVCEECTCCDPKLFFSHRYSKGLRGTMCAVIAL